MSVGETWDWRVDNVALDFVLCDKADVAWTRLTH